MGGWVWKGSCGRKWPLSVLSQGSRLGVLRGFMSVSVGSSPEIQDHGKGGLSLRGVAVTTETAITAKTVKTVTVASLT